MKRALKGLLRKLEAIAEDCDGLGDTNIRSHMAAHVRRGFLQPEPDFETSGEYGLTPQADRRVAAALKAFCKAAAAAAIREGLQTPEQRLAAFQDRSVTGPRGGSIEDYFGVLVSPMAAAPPAGGLSGRKGVRFGWPGTLDELCAALNAAGAWRWFAIRQYRDPFLECHPGDWLWGKIRAEKKSKQVFFAMLEAEPGTKKIGVDSLLADFHALLAVLMASDVADANPNSW